MGSDGSAEPTPPGGSAGGRRRGRFPGATSGGGVAGAPPRRGTGPAADADVFASGSAEADAFASGPQSAGASAYPSDADVLASGSAEADAFASDTTGSASAGRSFDAAAFADADAVASRPSSADAFASRPPSAGEFASRLPSAGASVQPSDADVFASASADADVFASGPPSAGASAYPSDADVFASASAGAEVFASGSPSADFAFPAGAVGSSLSRRSAGARASGGPGEATPSGRSAHRAARARRARRRNVALAVVTVSGLVVLPLVLWSALGSGDGPAPAGKDASSPAPGKDAKSPGASWAGRHRAGQGTLHGRLHNLASGLCVGVVGKKAVEGAETELAPCSTTLSQQWAYEPDGLLRNSAAPGLCLDSHLGYSVRLAPCSATGEAARNIRYDFTLQGALIPRWNQDLALTPAATDGSGALVLKDRAPGAAQRWTLDTAKPDLQMQNVDWDSDAAPSPVASPHPRTDATPAPKASRTTSAPRTPSPTATGSGPAATPSAPVDPCSAHPYYCGWGSGGYGDGGGYGGGPHRR
ncbi:ricin-type beta-trefoil lectin domain protein [Streptomyces barringtoniae]|uniref:ricin-type beta-trefoil lectin domain protein n=1 Tax=Streptomyces barringtoniae TaxID=2892029 RepID=UPI003FD7D9D3